MSDKKRRRVMSQTERDLAGLEAARGRARSHAERFVEDESDGSVRDYEDPELITSPVELLSRELTNSQEELARDLGFDLDAPVSFAQFVKLLERVNDVKREERRSHREQSNRLLKAMGSKPPTEEIRSLRIKVNIMWALLLLAVVAAGSSLLSTAKWLKQSGREEAERQQLIDSTSDHEKRLRRLEWTNEAEWTRRQKQE